MSLVQAAQKHFSDDILGQTFRYAQNEALSNNSDGTSRKCFYEEKVMTFRRNDIFFDNRPSVMLNLRDVSEEVTLRDMEEKVESLTTLTQSLCNDLIGPLKSADLNSETLLLNQNIPKRQRVELLQQIQNSTRFSQL